MRSFFAYYGSKYIRAPLYPRPRYDIIIEPFAGSACYATRRHNRRKVILVEKYEVEPKPDQRESAALFRLEARSPGDAAGSVSPASKGDG